MFIYVSCGICERSGCLYFEFEFSEVKNRKDLGDLVLFWWGKDVGFVCI